MVWLDELNFFDFLRPVSRRIFDDDLSSLGVDLFNLDCGLEWPTGLFRGRRLPSFESLTPSHKYFFY